MKKKMKAIHKIPVAWAQCRNSWKQYTIKKKTFKFKYTEVACESFTLQKHKHNVVTNKKIEYHLTTAPWRSKPCLKVGKSTILRHFKSNVFHIYTVPFRSEDILTTAFV